MSEPLWQVMSAAYERSGPPAGTERWEENHGYAAELRAINIWIAEHMTQRRNTLTGEVTYLVSELHSALDAEADRAEAGE